MTMWVALIQDWLILSTQPFSVQAVYSPRLFTAPSPSVLTTVLPFLQTAWPSVLSAACSLVPPAKVAPFLSFQNPNRGLPAIVTVGLIPEDRYADR